MRRPLAVRSSIQSTLQSPTLSSQNLTQATQNWSEPIEKKERNRMKRKQRETSSQDTRLSLISWEFSLSNAMTIISAILLMLSV